MRLTFAYVEDFANRKGINIERVGKRYEVWTTGSVVAECANLAEAYSEVYYWQESPLDTPAARAQTTARIQALLSGV